MVEETVKTHNVAYERDASGWWVASVRELRGCHTQGRTVDEARRAATAARRAVRVLRGGRLKMSARDAAQFLGLSHQRIHQLAQEGSERG